MKSDVTLQLKQFLEEDTNRKQLVYISVDRLIPHPDNPRKDLGDLSELTDSIIANGVMQNLTVVPSINNTDDYNRMVDMEEKVSAAYRNHAINQAFTGNYTIVIGHRRHAAAVPAGVKELPCVVVDMDYPTQIATMMTENLQRVDLTVYEQAQGFKQLSMDFGMSVEKIAEKTGFSTSTVRRRLKMAELNQDTLKSVSGRQINLADFERLDKIEDEKLRDEALKEIGTANFNNKVAYAEQELAKRKRKAELRQMCLDAGLKEISEATGNKNEKYTRVKAFYGTPRADDLKECVEKEDDLCFYVDRWNYVYLVSPKKQGKEGKLSKEQEERDRKESERKAACAALDEAFERAYELRYAFIKSFTDAKAKACFAEIVSAFVSAEVHDYDGCFDADTVALLGGDMEQFEDADADNDRFLMVQGIVVSQPYLSTLAMAYTAMSDHKQRNCRDWYARYAKNGPLDRLYEFLCSIGYEINERRREGADERRQRALPKGDLIWRTQENGCFWR